MDSLCAFILILAIPSDMSISAASNNFDTFSVCLISHSPALGGGERILLELVDALMARGVGCHVIVPWWGPLRRALKHRGIHQAVLPFLWWAAPSRAWLPRIGRTIVNLLATPWIALRIWTWQSTLILTNSTVINVGLLAARLLRKPHVLHILEFGELDQDLTYDWGRTAAAKLMDEVSCAVMVCSDAVAQSWKLDFAHGKLTVVRQAVTLPRSAFREGPSTQEGARPFRIVVVGNIQRGKAQEDAIRGLRLLLQKGLRAELHLIGRTTQRAYAQFLRELIMAEQIEKQVFWHGHLKNPLEVMQQADVVVSCAPHEALGRATIEAMQLGKAVVAAAGGGTPELIRDGENGLLYTPGCAKELAEQLARLKTQPLLGNHLGARARTCALERFSTSRFGDEALILLRSCLVAVTK